MSEAISKPKVDKVVNKNKVIIYDTLSNFQILYYVKDPNTGKMIDGGWGGEYHGYNKAKNAEIMDGVDSISIKKIK